MFKALLQDTLPQFNYQTEKLSQKSGVPAEKLNKFLDNSSDVEPTAAEFAAIIKALPATIKDGLKQLTDSAIEELDYVDAQLCMIESSCDDSKQPLYSGMRRVLRRIIAN